MSASPTRLPVAWERRRPLRWVAPALAVLLAAACAPVPRAGLPAAGSSGPHAAAAPGGRTVASGWPHLFSVLSYNALLLPEDWFGLDQRLRAQLLPAQLPAVDAIVFQELFDDPARRILLERLEADYPFRTRLLDAGDGFLRQNGGVVIASRWPIEVQDRLAFGETCSGTDCLADKGIVYARIVKGSRRYHLFGTHAQSDYGGEPAEVRAAQFRLFRAFVDAQDIPDDEPVLLAGDFNVDRYAATEFGGMLAALDAILPDPGGPAFTWDGPRNSLAEGRERHYLDYVLVARDHLRPLRAGNEVLILRSDAYPRGDLSDHYAVLGTFVFAPYLRPELPR